MDKKFFVFSMNYKIRLLFVILIILCISLLSVILLSRDDYYEPDKSGLNISVVLTTSDFSDIFHDTVILSSDKKMKLNKNDGIEVVPKNEEYCFKKEDYVVGDKIHIQAVEDAKISILTIERAYGIGQYMGTLDVYCTKDGFVVVNTLPLESYLRYVVPSEMPSDYGIEALKAQAVCARNFAIQHIVNPAYPQYNASLDDSIKYQVYNNQISNKNTDRAIKETNNMVLKYNNEIISTYYYSTSCGHSTDLSLWSNDSVPYYMSLSMNENREYMDLCSEENFKRFLTEYKDAYEADEPWYRWTYFISLDDIKNNLNTYLDIEVNEIDEIEILTRRAGGSVSKLQVIADGKGYTLTKESEVRNIFVPFNSDISRNDGSVLDGYTKCPSSYYILEETYDGDVLTGYVLSGGGCGHGLGMSQNCSKILASEGKNYKEILKYFYIGTEVVAFD